MKNAVQKKSRNFALTVRQLGGESRNFRNPLWMLLRLIRECVSEFEAEHGKIVLPEDK